MRKLVYILILILLSISISASAQTQERRIIDTSGNPLNAVTIIIPDLNRSIISNKDGRFRLVIGEKEQTLILKNPGYKEVIYI